MKMNACEIKEILRKNVETNKSFYEKEVIIDGVPVSIFNYIIAPTPKDFNSPLVEEMRGIAVTPMKTYFALPKFYNINECEGWMESDVRDDEIVNVYEKYDGSLINFIEINGNWYAKSKASFISTQAVIAQEILDYDNNLLEFLKMCDEIGYHPVFELIGEDNRHILDYKFTNRLILLDIREFNPKTMKTTSVLEKDQSLKNMVVRPMRYDGKSLEEMLEEKKNLVDTEGWVVHFKSGKIAKIKTDWYFRMHNTISNFLEKRVDITLSHYLNEDLDDAITVLKENNFNDEILFIEETIETYKDWMFKISSEIENMYNETVGMESKEIAMKYKDKQPHFHILMKVRREKFYDINKPIIEHLKEYTKKNIRKKEIGENWWNSYVLKLELRTKKL